MSANVGPYIANLQLEQRRRELRAGRFEPLAGAFNDIEKTMFALSELNERKAKDRAELLTSAMQMYGGDAPQGLVNEWTGAVERASGAKKPFLPRDSQGNAIPPSPDIFSSPEERNLLRHLSPADRDKYYKVKAGLLPTAQKQADLEWKKEYQGRMASIQEKRNAILAARQMKGSDLEKPSGFGVVDGQLVRVEPGDSRELTQRQLNNIVKVQGLDEKYLQAEERQIKIKALKASLDAGGTEGKLRMTVLRDAISTKDPRTIAGAWDSLREWALYHGMQDIGPTPAPKTIVDYVNELLGTTVALSKPTPSRSGHAAKPKVDVDKIIEMRDAAVARGDYEEAARLESNFQKETATQRTIRTPSGRQVIVEP
jgi:hypothetical protein